MLIARRPAHVNNLFMSDMIQRIDKRLDEIKKTWADLGRAVGASDQRTYNWRSRGIPKSAMLGVAAFLGWTVDHLLTGAGPKREGEPPLPEPGNVTRADVFFDHRHGKYDGATSRYQKAADKLLDLPEQAMDHIEPLLDDLSKLYGQG